MLSQSDYEGPITKPNLWFSVNLTLWLVGNSIESATAPLSAKSASHIVYKYNILHCAMKGMLVFAMCHYNYISSWEVSFCCGCRQQGPPARVVFFYSGKSWCGKKLLFSKAKMFFPLAMWKNFPFACTPAMLVSYLWQKLKENIAKPGDCLGDPFYCARAWSNDPVAVEKDIIRSSKSSTKKVAQTMSWL